MSSRRSHRARRSLALLALLSILALAQTTAAAAAAERTTPPPQPSWRLIEANDAGIVLELRSPRPTIEQRGSWDELTLPGWPQEDRPGWPALPVGATLVALPWGADWQIEVEAQETQPLPGRYRLPPAPTPLLPPPAPARWGQPDRRPATLAVVEQPDAAIYSRPALHPAVPAQAGEPAIWRGYRLLPLRLYPLQFNPVSGQVVHQRRLRVAVRFTGGRPAPDGGQPPLADPAFDHLPASLVVNFEQARNSAYRLRRNPAGAALPPFRPLQPSLRIRTGPTGLYRLTCADLATAGLDPEALDPATLRLTVGGETAALEVIGEEDGRCDPADELRFWGQAYEGRYANENVYQLAWGETPGPRMARRNVAPGAAAPPAVSFRRTVRIEPQVQYRSDHRGPTDDHWFDQELYVFSSQPSSSRSYPLDLPAADLAAEDPTVRGLLRGGLAQAADPDNAARLRLNGYALGDFTWNGARDLAFEVTAPITALLPAGNTLRVTAALSDLPDVASFWVFPDWFEIEYSAGYRADADVLFVEQGPVGAHEVRAEGFSAATGGDLLLYDVTDPQAPLRLTGAQALESGEGYALRFEDAPQQSPSYLLLGANRLLAPLAIELDEPADLASPANEADYIVIAHPSLLAAVQPLAARRRAQGLRVAVVDVQDVYDEFSFGRLDPQAIQDFVRVAYHNWNSQSPAGLNGPPSYLLLVGDGHYDFRNYGGSDLPNLLPPYLVAVDPWIGETAADGRFASLDGPGDYLPELHVGRLPATTPAEAAAVVSKTLAYEETAAGDWQRAVTFVADDPDTGAGNFHAYSDDVADHWLPASFSADRVHFMANYDEPAAVQAAIVAAFGAGRLLVQWFGHASRFRWGSQRVFSTLDAAALPTGGPYPLTLSFTCWSGYFINTSYSSFYGTHRSLGEALVLAPDRGSVADLSPTGLHVGSALRNLNRGIYQALFQGGEGQAGAAVTAGKLYHFAHSAHWPDLIDTLAFFGDPALTLRLPQAPDLSSSTLAATPAAVRPGSALTYTLTLSNSGAAPLQGVRVTADYDQDALAITGAAGLYDDDGDALRWQLGALPAGTLPLTITAQVREAAPAPAVGAIRLRAVVQSAGLYPQALQVTVTLGDVRRLYLPHVP